ncbi:MAG TPA: hypothetical protein VFJ85_18050 [Acidimicrobiales bacterium]|nr:hypothetical protein [Acidimicrobiales bacterium]
MHLQITMLHTYLKSFARTRVGSERGASLVEYALLLALIAIVCIVAIQFIGNASNKSLSSAGSAVNG